MKVAVVAAGGVPNATTGGGALTQWTTIVHLVERGHDVTVYSLSDPSFRDWTGTSTGDRLARLEELGARTVQLDDRLPPLPRGPLPARVRRLLRPLDVELYPHQRHAETVRAAVSRGGHDVAWVYHFEALAASRGLRRVLPRYAAVGDPSHLPPLYHWRLDPSLRGAPRLLRSPALARLARRLVHECEGAGAFAAHHARQLGVEYLRTPVPDDAGPGWHEQRERHRAKQRPTILLVGHLAGAVTVDGLRTFGKVLPLIERELGAEGFEVRVVGGHEPPRELRETFARPSVRRVGHVEDAADEFRAGDVLLVPTSIPLGIRVRVITAWSFGTCVVAHRVNALGTPELVDGETGLLGSSPEELAARVLQALRDLDLRRRIEAGGRDAYERAFAPTVAAGVLESRLATLAKQ